MSYLGCQGKNVIIFFPIQNKPSKYFQTLCFPWKCPAPVWGQRAQVVCPGLVEGVQGPGVLLCLFLCDLGPRTARLWASVPFIWYQSGGGGLYLTLPSLEVAGKLQGAHGLRGLRNQQGLNVGESAGRS